MCCCDALTDYWWRQRRGEAIIRAQTESCAPPAELLAAGVGRAWSRWVLLSVQIARSTLRLSTLGPPREARRAALLSLSSRLLLSSERRCASLRSASSDVGSSESGQQLITVVASDRFESFSEAFRLIKKKKEKKERKDKFWIVCPLTGL